MGLPLRFCEPVQKSVTAFKASWSIADKPRDLPLQPRAKSLLASGHRWWRSVRLIDQRDIEMPLPLIIGAAALVSAAYGAKKGYDGYQKHSEADDIVNNAKARYAKTKATFDAQEKATTGALTVLGEDELKMGEQFNEFKTLADKLLAQLNSGRQKKLDINVPKYQLQRIEDYSYTAIGVLGAAAGAGMAGAAAGFAVYGGVMALGAASTGTAISSLAGVAASNAALAAIGGGSLATGGLGMAGGTAILGAAVAGPVLAIAGWAYNSHGEEALKNASKASREVDSAQAKLEKAKAHLSKVEDYGFELLEVLKGVYAQFEPYFQILKAIDSQVEAAKVLKQNPDEVLARVCDTVVQSVSNGFTLASILVNLITTPLFKVKKANGEVVLDENNVPVMDTDADGSMVLNTEELDAKIAYTKTRAGEVAPA
ncbi:hypothetical protein [Pseudomonas sp. NPDC007930]|uniref:hypothetical protein n=1 Tax=Pseudomonas sp. NPDC007930 TaxID=3364417 RepID=UPI0036E7EE09